MYLKKTPNAHAASAFLLWILITIKRKNVRQPKTVESIGWLDELQKQYKDRLPHFTKRAAELNEEKQKKQARSSLLFTIQTDFAW